ncbi:MAG: NAD-dependent epimerase/dehydratase family protein [Gaiellaceae bacterium]
MNILVTGNMGYVGGPVVRHLRSSRPHAHLTGLDVGYFGHCIGDGAVLPECLLDQLYLADVRDVPDAALRGVDAVVHLAAVSNDPVGNAFEEVTVAVNERATVELARRARDAGARSFVFASSCSMYGFAEGGARTEDSPLDPLTAYSRSKVEAERGLASLADDGFAVTSLRFGTACGMSDRLRLDLVLNDFAASAVATGRVVLLSDGTPWRPLVHVRDMARAIDWAVEREADGSGAFLALNVGADSWNFQMRELAEAVVAVVAGAELEISGDAQPDRRSYRVSFARFEALAPDHQPRVNLEAAIEELVTALRQMEFSDRDFRSSSRHVRLNLLNALRRDGLLTEDLRWVDVPQRVATPAR